MKTFDWDHKTVRRNAILVMILVTLVLVMHEIFGDHGYLALRRQKRQYQALQQQIDALSRQNKQLDQRIKSLKSNPDTIEKQAREQLHLVRPGEFIYMLPNKQRSQTPSTAQNSSQKK